MRPDPGASRLHCDRRIDNLTRQSCLRPKLRLHDDGRSAFEWVVPLPESEYQRCFPLCGDAMFAYTHGLPWTSASEARRRKRRLVSTIVAHKVSTFHASSCSHEAYLTGRAARRLAVTYSVNSIACHGFIFSAQTYSVSSLLYKCYKHLCASQSSIWVSFDSHQRPPLAFWGHGFVRKRERLSTTFEYRYRGIDQGSAALLSCPHALGILSTVTPHEISVAGTRGRVAQDMPSPIILDLLEGIFAETQVRLAWLGVRLPKID